MFHWIASGNKSALIIIIFCSCIYNVSFLIWLVLCFVFIFPLSLAFTTWLSYAVFCMSLWFCCVSLKFLHPMVISQFSSAQSCPTLCDPMNRSTPGLPVHHQLPEFTQTHIHWVSDAIQPSHPLSSPSPPAPNPSQHQSLFQWVNSSHQVAKVLEFQL